MTHSPEMQVKIPIGSIAKADEIGLKREYLYYYQLKRVNSQGFIARGSYVKEIKRVTGYSTPYILKMNKRLIDCGFLRFGKNGKKEGLQLISYGEIWKILGYEVKTDVNRIKSKGIYLAKYIGNSPYPQHERVYLVRVKADFNTVQELEQAYLLEYVKHTQNMAETVKDDGRRRKTVDSNHVKISCSKAAKQLGKKSKMSGYRHLQKLADGLYVKKKTNKEDFVTNITLTDARNDHEWRFLDKNGNIKFLWWKYYKRSKGDDKLGTLYINHCNTYSVIGHLPVSYKKKKEVVFSDSNFDFRNIVKSLHDKSKLSLISDVL